MTVTRPAGWYAKRLDRTPADACWSRSNAGYGKIAAVGPDGSSSST
jgi:hypothetical protein